MIPTESWQTISERQLISELIEPCQQPTTGGTCESEAPPRKAKRGRPTGTTGTGRWGKYKGEMRRVWVPENIAYKLPELIQDLREVVDAYDELTECDDYSKNPRKALARRLVEDLKAITESID